MRLRAYANCCCLLLGRLCDGERRAGDDELVKSVAEALQTSEAARMLRNATWLQVDLKGTGAKPARTIGTVVRSLGGVSDAKRVGPSQHPPLNAKSSAPKRNTDQFLLLVTPPLRG